MAKKVVSIINLASVAEVENAAGAPVNPLRFRGNLYVAGWPAWHEFDLLDRELAIGAVRLKVVKRIQRCAATEVDPDTGIRDVAVPRTLMDNFGHADCGIYAEVIAGGDIAVPATRSPPRRGLASARHRLAGVGEVLIVRPVLRRLGARLYAEQPSERRIERQIAP